MMFMPLLVVGLSVEVVTKTSHDFPMREKVGLGWTLAGTSLVIG